MKMKNDDVKRTLFFFWKLHLNKIQKDQELAYADAIWTVAVAVDNQLKRFTGATNALHCTALHCPLSTAGATTQTLVNYDICSIWQVH